MVDIRTEAYSIWERTPCTRGRADGREASAKLPSYILSRNYYLPLILPLSSLQPPPLKLWSGIPRTSAHSPCPPSIFKYRTKQFKGRSTQAEARSVCPHPLWNSVTTRSGVNDPSALRRRNPSELTPIIP